MKVMISRAIVLLMGLMLMPIGKGYASEGDFSKEWGLWYDGASNTPQVNSADVNPYASAPTPSANLAKPSLNSANGTIHTYASGVNGPDKAEDDRVIYVKADALKNLNSGGMYFQNSLYYNANSANTKRGIFPTEQTNYKYFTFMLDMYFVSENTGMFLGTDREINGTPQTKEVYYAGTGTTALTTTGPKITGLTARQWHNVAWQFSTDGTSNDVLVYIDGQLKETYSSQGNKGFELAGLYFHAKANSSLEVYLDNIKTGYGNTPYSASAPPSLTPIDNIMTVEEDGQINILKEEMTAAEMQEKTNYIAMNGKTKQIADSDYALGNGDYLYSVTADGIYRYYTIKMELQQYTSSWPFSSAATSLTLSQPKNWKIQANVMEDKAENDTDAVYYSTTKPYADGDKKCRKMSFITNEKAGASLAGVSPYVGFLNNANAGIKATHYVFSVDVLPVSEMSGFYILLRAGGEVSRVVEFSIGDEVTRGQWNNLALEFVTTETAPGVYSADAVYMKYVNGKLIGSGTLENAVSPSNNTLDRVHLGTVFEKGQRPCYYLDNHKLFYGNHAYEKSDKWIDYIPATIDSVVDTRNQCIYAKFGINTELFVQTIVSDGTKSLWRNVLSDGTTEKIDSAELTDNDSVLVIEKDGIVTAYPIAVLSNELKVFNASLAQSGEENRFKLSFSYMNTLSQTDCNLYIAAYDSERDNMLTDIREMAGIPLNENGDFSDEITLNATSDNKIKCFFWSDNLEPYCGITVLN